MIKEKSIMENNNQKIYQEIYDFIQNADAVLIGASNGLSISDG